ncbi:MAG: hypothetical protein NZ742_07185 [Acidobacteria bacterium]|nr:hypothetical protein [Acidobacteriota bacterium]MDW7983765.1 hypothetical protein [Acidobacteriota bacterium]
MLRRVVVWLGSVGALTCVSACASPWIETRVPLSTRPQVALQTYEAIAVLPFLTYQEFRVPDARGEPSIDYGQEVTAFVRNQIQIHVDRPVMALDWVDLPASASPETGELPALPVWEADGFALTWLERHLGLDRLGGIARPVVVFGILIVRQQYAFLNASSGSTTLIRRSTEPVVPPSTTPMVRQFGVGIRLFAIDWGNRAVLYTDYVEASMDLLDVFWMHRDIQAWDAERIRMVAFYTLLDRTVPLLLGNIIPLPVMRERLLVRE